MYAKLIEPVLDECHLPVVVVGHSFGGRVAVHLNERRPDAIAGLVLTGVPLLHKAHDHGKVAYQYRVGKWLNRLKLVNDDFVENLKNKYGSADYRAAEGVMRDILVTCVNESYGEELKKILCPVDLIWGDGDTAVPPEIAARAEALINDVRLTILGNVDHFVPTMAPLALKETIQLQLAALDD
jgi:pimeloyl-ACP methyl ester carboxylesterase|tara:strand:+ start:1895 stop:2443 length:549 start_codon:yes stop_codon:yes gene_type:complete